MREVLQTWRRGRKINKKDICKEASDCKRIFKDIEDCKNHRRYRW